MPTQTEYADAEARAAELFKQKCQELEAMKTLYKKLLNESKKQTCDDCSEELYWSKKRESELCPNCDIDESDDEDEEKTCHTCKKEYEVEPGRGGYEDHKCLECFEEEDK